MAIDSKEELLLRKDDYGPNAMCGDMVKVLR